MARDPDEPQAAAPLILRFGDGGKHAPEALISELSTGNMEANEFGDIAQEEPEDLEPWKWKWDGERWAADDQLTAPLAVSWPKRIALPISPWANGLADRPDP